MDKGEEGEKLGTMLRSRGEEDSGGEEEEEEVVLGVKGNLEELLCTGLFDIFILILLILLFDIIAGNEKVGAPRLPATEGAGPVARATT